MSGYTGGGNAVLSNNPTVNGSLTVAPLATPLTPIVVPHCPSGACATSWTYAISYDGPNSTTTAACGTAPYFYCASETNNATLDATHYMVIAPNPQICTAGVSTYEVYRTISGGTPATTGKISATPVACGTSFEDNGVAGDSSTPPSVAGKPGMWRGL